VAVPSVRLHPDAIAEAKAAYEWYAERSPSAADAFLFELDHAISRIQEKSGALDHILAWHKEISSPAFPVRSNLSEDQTRHSGHRCRPWAPPSGLLEEATVLKQISS
jgi:glutathione S-transferase